MNSQTITDLVAHVTSECSIIDREQRFRDVLDDSYSFDSVGGPFANMSPSSVLEKCDPIAFRCGVNDYMDGQEVEIEGDSYDLDEVEAAKEFFLSDLESEKSDIESKLEEMEDEGVNRFTLDLTRNDLVAIQSKIAEVRAYSF